MLTGFALPAALLPGADHTYVLSDQGHMWSCFGRSSGGQTLCSGQGNAAFADCLSQPNSTAGLSYGITGVCHQAANRILYPAGTFVDNARGYRLSVFRFSVYGKGTWVELQACARLRATGRPPPPKGTPVSQSRLTKILKSFFDRFTSSGASEDQIRHAEFSALWDSSLGEDYALEKKSQISQLQAQMRRLQEELAGRFEIGQISSDEYLAKTQSITNDILTKCERILGPADFERLFGESREHAYELVDPEIFRQVHLHR